MSWGGPQQQQNYSGYGQGPQQPAYGAPQTGQYGAPPGGQYGAPPGGQYGAPPGGQYGAPPGGQYGAPPRGQPGAPPGGQYGAPPQGQYGAPPGSRPGVPPPGQYGAPTGGQYGAPPGSQPGAPPPGQYGTPPPGQYGARPGAPPQGQYGAPPGQAYGAPPGQQPAGYGAPQGYGSAPPPAAGGGYGAQPPPGVSSEVFTWFQNVDSDRSGKITANELQHALMNGNWSPFNAETCRLMIGMFDKDRNGTIDVHEFAALWKYIQDWKGCFDRFDMDRSGNIDANELGNAFRQFGYTLSPQFSQTVIRTFDRRRGGHSINFDDFIQACVMLKTLTDTFRVKDTAQNGSIRISYEEFLEMVLDTTINK